jgi:hypothetical protein
MAGLIFIFCAYLLIPFLAIIGIGSLIWALVR